MVKPEDYGTQAEADELREKYKDVKVITENLCFNCKHLLKYPACAAFPKVIPYEIRWGFNLHKEPFPGDHGIQYESLLPPKKAEPKAEEKPAEAEKPPAKPKE